MTDDSEVLASLRRIETKLDADIAELRTGLHGIQQDIRLLRAELKGQFDATLNELTAIKHRADMVTTSLNDMAAIRPTQGEITVLHDELKSLREQLLRYDVRLRVLESQGAE